MRTCPPWARGTTIFARREEINALINESTRLDTQAAWIARINAAGVPCGRVQDLKEALSDPQVLAQEMVIDVDQPGHGTVRMLGFPVKLDETPCSVRLPAPELGAHTDDVLQAAGYSPDEIAELHAQGVVGTAASAKLERYAR